MEIWMRSLISASVRSSSLPDVLHLIISSSLEYFVWVLPSSLTARLCLLVASVPACLLPIAFLVIGPWFCLCVMPFIYVCSADWSHVDRAWFEWRFFALIQTRITNTGVSSCDKPPSEPPVSEGRSSSPRSSSLYSVFWWNLCNITVLLTTKPCRFFPLCHL